MPRSPRAGLRGARVCLAGLACLSLVACGEDKDPNADAKAVFEQAAGVIGGPVGEISAFQPHLDPPKFEGKYAPQDRTDQTAATYYAADAIRHRANGARQKLTPIAHPDVKALVAPFTEVAKVCATPDDPADLETCKKALAALDEALAAAETKAKAAGLSSFPRVGDAAVTDAAKEAVQPFIDAKGPSASEAALLGKMSDPKASPDDVVATCEKADGEAKAVLKSVTDKGDTELEKVAAKHMIQVEAWCNRMKEMKGYLTDVKACEGQLDKNPDCKELCGKAKRRIKQGVLAAAFEPLPPLVEDVCDEKK